MAIFGVYEDGKKQTEEEEASYRRCLLLAAGVGTKTRFNALFYHRNDLNIISDL